MLNLKFIQNNKEIVKSKLASRGFAKSKIDEVFLLITNRSKYMSDLQNLEAKRNLVSKEIGVLKIRGDSAEKLITEMSQLKLVIEKVKVKEQEINSKISDLLLYIPNIPASDTPIGKSENDNVEIKEHILGRGKVATIIPHYKIGVSKKIIDFERTVKISRSRFWSYKGKAAKLLRALKSFMLDTHVENGYEEIHPPVLVNSKAMLRTGNLPKFKEDLFKIENHDLYLIPTSEVPLTNFYSNEILNLSKPIKFVAYTLCFRSEAGSGGKDMKGIIRSHQFNKVELVKIVTKKDYEKEFQLTLLDAKSILEMLELPYREIALCSSDLGFSSEKTIDLEVWMPSEDKYREVSSVSGFGNFQGRRAAIRYKDAKNQSQYAYTINASALAIDRIIAAIMENYQNPDGTITIPKVLQKYFKIKVI